MDTQAEVIQSLLGKQCWYASCGGGAGSSFQLALGEKVPRKTILRNQYHSEEYRRFEGEANLLVWCTWRLDSGTGPISSSDDTTEHIRGALARLVGAIVTDIKIDMPGWDLDIAFSNHLKLKVFCDHLPGDPSFDGNWELWIKNTYISIGVGSTCEVKPRVV